jgi:hypothetical protein
LSSVRGMLLMLREEREAGFQQALELAVLRPESASFRASH